MITYSVTIEQQKTAEVEVEANNREEAMATVAARDNTEYFVHSGGDVEVVDAEPLLLTSKADYTAAGCAGYHNGGGFWCMFMQGTEGREGLYVLITDEDDAELTFTTENVHVGLYDDRTGESLDGNNPTITTLADGPALAARLIRDYQEPTA